jgi:hypothetical protein
MRKGIHWKRFFKWCGTFACVVVGLAWAGTTWRGLTWTSQNHRRDIILGDGAIDFRQRLSGWTPAQEPFLLPSGWIIIDYAKNARRTIWWPRAGNSRSGKVLVVPFWILFVPIALSAAALWIRDPQYPFGHCRKCGYNLTGNVSGICPECGTAVERRTNQDTQSPPATQ